MHTISKVEYRMVKQINVQIPTGTKQSGSEARVLPHKVPGCTCSRLPRTQETLMRVLNQKLITKCSNLCNKVPRSKESYPNDALRYKEDKKSKSGPEMGVQVCALLFLSPVSA